MTHNYALILAGGTGTRLWPWSRSSRPKQLLELISDRSMLQETVARVEPLVPAQRILVMTNVGYVAEARRQLPHLPPENIIGEPAVRGTASAIGYGAVYIAHRDPAATMFSLHADHHIVDVEAFRRALVAAAEVAGQGYLVTLGVEPASPETGYGYIERGESLGEFHDHMAYRVMRFIEKPEQDRARAFVHSGRYYWNSGLFVWHVSTILDSFARYMPDTYAKLQAMARVIGTPDEQRKLEEIWPTLESQTIDYGIMEPAERVAVIAVDFGWSDVGSWDALLELLEPDQHHNVVLGDHIGLETRRSLIYSHDRLIATVGIEDLIVVDVGDVVLVCPRGRTQDVKTIVERLRRENRIDVL